MMNINLVITAFLGAIVIVLGAFGAHVLKEKLGVGSLSIFETGVRYQMYHVIVLLFINTYVGFTIKTKNVISLLFFFGILFFSGSLYLISLGFVTAKEIWFTTPLGGFLFLIGWVTMIFSFINNQYIVNK